METMTFEEKDALFTEYLQKPPYPAAEMAKLIAAVPETTADQWTALALTAFAEAQDFASAFVLVRARKLELSKKLAGAAVRDSLRKTTKDRLVLAYIDSAQFAERPLEEAVSRLEKLLGFRKNAYVLSSAWGFGKIRDLDYFYRRATIDFKGRPGHKMTFEAACDTLSPAPDSHILVVAEVNPDLLKGWLDGQEDEFVVQMLSSFGDMPVSRLEELAAEYGFVKSGAAWKAFWEKARTKLRQRSAAGGRPDACVVDIPARRTEPLHLRKTGGEKYGADWFSAFSQMTDPKSILSSVREFQAGMRGSKAAASGEAGEDGESKPASADAAEFRNLDGEGRAKLAERLAFALKGARGVDDALYAQLAMCMDELKLDAKDRDGKPAGTVAKARKRLWESNRYLDAGKNLPARESAAFVRFLTEENGESSKKELFAALPEMCFSMLSATLSVFIKDADCEEVCATLLRDPAAPATLVTYVLARYDQFKHWTRLPGLLVVLTHAIALGEGRQSGETLKMQNTVRRLFADRTWLEKMFSMLPEADQARFFERFQASQSWDPATHHMIVTRMAKLAPALAALQLKKAAPKRDVRFTSLRSYAEREAAYRKMVTVDIPKNARDIDEARGYGDLRENFEYQSAKDKQRELLLAQSKLQDELKAVKAVDFSDVSADAAGPGTMVVLRTASGEEKTYSILGEWDNDLALGIVSNRTQLALNLEGKKPGDAVELPDENGEKAMATIEAVRPLSDAIRAWINEKPAEA